MGACTIELALCIQLTMHQDRRSTHLLITHGHAPAEPLPAMTAGHWLAGHCAKDLAPRCSLPAPVHGKSQQQRAPATARNQSAREYAEAQSSIRACNHLLGLQLEGFLLRLPHVEFHSATPLTISPSQQVHAAARSCSHQSAPQRSAQPGEQQPRPL